jgi:histidine triad (HIT) family protein
VLDGKQSVAFLDIRPLFAGHVLVIPRVHRETFLDLTAEELAEIFGNSQTICRAIEQALGADGTFVAMNNRVSQSVPHAHVHLVPRRRKDGLRGFFWPRHEYESEAAAAELAETLRTAIRSLASSDHAE